MGMSWLTRPSLILRLFKRLRLAIRLLREPAVPLRLKLVPLAAGLYVLMPFDLIPDLLLVLGQLDDLAMVAAAVESFVGWCPPQLVAFHQTAIDDGRQFTPMPVPASGSVIDAEFHRDSQ
jgi:uncharacterized membrane protein YkvA (DUF1232 family)